MANNNLVAIRKVVNQYELQAQLIPNPNNPNNCSRVIVNGKEFKTTQWTKADAIDKLYELQGNPCKKEGFTEYNFADAIIDGFLHYYKSMSLHFTELINFKQTIGCVLKEYMELVETTETNQYQKWVTVMQDEHGENASNKIKSMLDSHEVYHVRGYIYNNFELVELFNLFCKTNNLTKTNDEIQQAIYKFINFISK